MTGPGHYREAERLAGIASGYDGQPSNHHVQAGQLAQVHALLALAALLLPLADPEEVP